MKRRCEACSSGPVVRFVHSNLSVHPSGHLTSLYTLYACLTPHTSQSTLPVCQLLPDVDEGRVATRLRSIFECCGHFTLDRPPSSLLANLLQVPQLGLSTHPLGTMSHCTLSHTERSSSSRSATSKAHTAGCFSLPNLTIHLSSPPSVRSSSSMIMERFKRCSFDGYAISGGTQGNGRGKASPSRCRTRHMDILNWVSSFSARCPVSLLINLLGRRFFSVLSAFSSSLQSDDEVSPSRDLPGFLLPS